MTEHFIMRAKERVTQDIPATVPLSACKAGKMHSILLPDGQKAIVIREGETLHAYLAVCPHMGADLAEGDYCAKNHRIRCAWHGYQFDAVSGKFCENVNIKMLQLLRKKSPCFDPSKQVHYSLRALSVRIENGQVSVDYKDHV